MSRRRRSSRPKQDEIQISEQDMRVISAQYSLIAQQEHIVRALNQTLYGFIKGAYNVDLEKTSWVLDAEKGTLKRVTNEQQ